MSVYRLKPKNDFLFKRLFGESDSKHLLIPLLNAILGAPSRRSISDVTVIDNKELTKQVMDGKSGRLDVRCETDYHEQIDIEVQIARELAMDKRSLFYISRMYTDSIKEGSDYTQLKKTIAINILEFDFLPSSHFHSMFQLRDSSAPEIVLADTIELHFLECAKFRRIMPDLRNPLHRWLLFLDERTTQQQMKELISMDGSIKSAEERLEWLSSDEKTRQLYEAREEELYERTSLFNAGIRKGTEETKLETAKKLLSLGVEIDKIEKATGLKQAQFMKD